MAGKGWMYAFLAYFLTHEKKKKLNLGIMAHCTIGGGLAYFSFFLRIYLFARRRKYLRHKEKKFNRNIIVIKGRVQLKILIVFTTKACNPPPKKTQINNKYFFY